MKKIILFLFILNSATNFGQCWKKISNNGGHTLLIKSDNTLWAWGHNAFGQLGDNTTTNRNIPVQIGSDNDWASVSAGQLTSIATKTNGTLWTWGSSLNGPNNLAPIQLGNATNWSHVFQCGHEQFFAIKTDGTLWTWGRNLGLSLGIGDTNVSTVVYLPTQVGTDNDWLSVNSSDFNTFGIKTNHTLWAWGNNAYGSLGDGSSIQRASPIQIGIDANWETVMAGGGNVTIGKKTNGTLWMWGKIYPNTPTQQGNDNDWKSIGSGNLSFFIATKNNGSIWSWGDNQFGQLGNGSTTDVLLPTQIPGNDWDQVFVGGGQTIGTKSNSIWTWGLNNAGQLGIGSNVNQSNITPLNGLPCIQLSDETFLTNLFVLYPNPATNTLYIQNTEALNINRISITDMYSKVVYISDNLSEINVEKFQKGIYIVTLQFSETFLHYKFIKR